MGTFTYRAKKEEMENSPFLSSLIDFREKFTSEYNSYMRKVRGLIKEIREEEDEQGTINDFIKYTDRLENFFNNFRFINDFDDEEFIYWIEVNSRKSNSKLVATPLKIDSELQKNLYINEKILLLLQLHNIFLLSVTREKIPFSCVTDMFDDYFDPYLGDKHYLDYVTQASFEGMIDSLLQSLNS